MFIVRDLEGGSPVIKQSPLASLGCDNLVSPLDQTVSKLLVGRNFLIQMCLISVSSSAEWSDQLVIFLEPWWTVCFLALWD